MSSRRTSLLLVVSSLCFGGAEKHTVALYNGLPRTRFRVGLAYLKSDEALLAQVDRGLEGGVECLSVSSRIDLAAARRLARLIDSCEADVVVCTNQYPVLYAMLARRYSSRRFAIAEVYHTTDLATRMDRLQMWLYRRLFRHCDLLVYVSRNQMAKWRREGLAARRDVAIPNGIDVEHFRDTTQASERIELRQSFGFRAGDFVVGVCAALRPEKAHGDWLEALARLRDRGVPAKGLAIGDGPERAAIEQRIAQLGLQGQVVITGLLANVIPAIAACDVMVMASHAVETFSIAALESMAMGKPLVMSDIGGASEQVVHGATGFLFPAGQVDTLVAHLEALQDPAVRAAFGSRASDIVAREFTIARMLASYGQEFEALAPALIEAAGN